MTAFTDDQLRAIIRNTAVSELSARATLTMLAQELLDLRADAPVVPPKRKHQPQRYAKKADWVKPEFVPAGLNSPHPENGYSTR